MSINQSIIALLAVFTTATSTDAQYARSIELPPGADEIELLNKFKSSWRAMNGEGVDEILQKASKFAQFVPRSWSINKSGDGAKSITLSWALRTNDKSGDEYTISWSARPDGTFELDANYAKSLELGSQAFALSLIENEVTSGEKNANTRFLNDISNLNFVETPQGSLGTLLAKGKCSLVDPPGMEYAKGQHRLQLSVNCNIPGPSYFTREGVVMFQKKDAQPWKPESFFAKRIATNPPGQWFAKPDPQEEATFAAASSAMRRMQRRQ
jgi:hypothetical protein